MVQNLPGNIKYVKRFTEEQLWDFAMLFLYESGRHDPKSHQGESFEVLAHRSPMFRNGIFQPWVEKNSLSIKINNHLLILGHDYDISEDGSTIIFKNAIKAL